MATDWSATRQAERNLVERNAAFIKTHEQEVLEKSIAGVKQALVDMYAVNSMKHSTDIMMVVERLGSLQAKLERDLEHMRSAEGQ